MSDFNWNGDDAEAIVLEWQPRTAVCRTKGGSVCIRQECDGYTEDRDDQILLTPLGALQVGWKIIETAHEVGIPKPDRKVLAKALDLGPSEPPGPLLQVMQEAAE
jgi:hypothetical protein